ncbi:NAD(P)-dependent alcohol dehydrogenase [Pedobacter lithocola]|uniref:NAD(P)-dependent alcohol dehydrogenase n=1 Tax=Pedobacter lithocola TaxID=1908239 RepID=A0ABV8PEL2_9SPHI
MKNKMKAWRLHDFGMNNFSMDIISVPVPNFNEVLIKVSAVSLNYRDKAILEGNYSADILKNGPLTLVSDAVGVIVAIGSGVRRFKEGDRVLTHLHSNWLDDPRKPDEADFMFGGPLQGALAEFMVANENGLVMSPAYLTDEEACTLPIAALTAWYALNSIGQLKRGNTVLIQGTGGVALFAVQIAKAMGVEATVITSQNTKGEKTLQLGAKHYINYTSEPNWDEKVLALTHNEGVDEVLEVAGGDLNKSIMATKTSGLITLIGFLEHPEISFNMFPVIIKQINLQGISTGHRKAFEEMIDFFNVHRINPVIDSVHTFENSPNAFRRLEEGAFGKIVIKVNPLKQ